VLCGWTIDSTARYPVIAHNCVEIPRNNSLIHLVGMSISTYTVQRGLLDIEDRRIIRLVRHRWTPDHVRYRVQRRKLGGGTYIRYIIRAFTGLVLLQQLVRSRSNGNVNHQRWSSEAHDRICTSRRQTLPVHFQISSPFCIVQGMRFAFSIGQTDPTCA
jgi:hypothetical protein